MMITHIYYCIAAFCPYGRGSKVKLDSQSVSVYFKKCEYINFQLSPWHEN